jgi:hypothetical protein
MTQLPAEIAPANRLLTAAEFHRLGSAGDAVAQKIRCTGLDAGERR